MRRLHERVREGIERLHQEGLYPEAGSIVPGSGISFGLGVRRLRVFEQQGIAGEVQASWSVRGYRQYDAVLGKIDHLRSTLQLRPADANLSALFNDSAVKAPGTATYLAVRYRRSPRVDFFGVGPARPEIETDYAVSGSSVDAVVQWQPSAVFGLSVRAGVLDLQTGRGADDETPDVEDRFGPDEAPGLLRQPRYTTAGVGLAVDTRNPVRFPTSGVFIGAALWRFVPLDAHSESFTRGAIDWRAYRAFVPGRDSHVVAARLLASLDQAPNHSPVPFYLQRWLGGSQSLRGYESYRFRGQAVVHLSLEHRWRAARFIEIVPFVDAGAIATSVRALGSSPLEVIPGIGVRVRTDERVLVRVDWARRSDGHRLLFSLTPAF
jgi:hypothetical protein